MLLSSALNCPALNWLAFPGCHCDNYTAHIVRRIRWSCTRIERILHDCLELLATTPDTGTVPVELDSRSPLSINDFRLA
jgi:hypothetical protein